MNEVSTHYIDENARNYYEGRFGGISEFGRVFQSSYFHPYCGSETRLLDFGCGDGTLLRALPAKSKIGIEVNQYCHEFIRQTNAGVSPQIQVLENIGSVEDQSIDVAISNHSMEHALEPYRTLLEIRRVLVPGGRLIVVTPFDDWRAGRHKIWSRGDKDHHVFTWSPLNIGNLIYEAGFEVQQAKLSTLAWSPKIFWIGRIFGLDIFRVACRCLAVLKSRREVVCVAWKPAAA